MFQNPQTQNRTFRRQSDIPGMFQTLQDDPDYRILYISLIWGYFLMLTLSSRTPLLHAYMVSISFRHS